MTPSNVETELAEKINIADITILINYEGLENAKNECESVVEQLEKGEAPAQQQITPVEPPILERLQSIDDDLRQMPAFQFITRPDLYQYAMVGYHYDLTIKGLTLLIAGEKKCMVC